MKKTSQNSESAGKRIAIFPGSFDPFTVGHESIVNRALPLFDEIIVAIGVNMAKKSLTSTEQRMAMIRSVYANEQKVKVVSYTGLTVDLAREHNASFLLRGVRMIQDFEYEKNIAEVNRALSGLETVLLYTLPEHGHISSSIVRELVRYRQNVAAFLPKGIDHSLLPTDWVVE